MLPAFLLSQANIRKSPEGFSLERVSINEDVVKVLMKADVSRAVEGWIQRRPLFLQTFSVAIF